MENQTNCSIHNLKKYIMKLNDLCENLESDLLKIDIAPNDEFTESILYAIDRYISSIKSYLKKAYSIVAYLDFKNRSIS